MPQLKILNSREIKEIYSLIEKQWGAKLNLSYAFLKREKIKDFLPPENSKNFLGNNKNRIFVVNRSISNIDLSKLRINSIGMYFCEADKIGIRLSIEGSQIVGPKATKNIAEITEEQAKKWLKGEDLEIKGDYSGFIILKNNGDFLGAGRHKDGKILNYVAKERRISSL